MIRLHIPVLTPRLLLLAVAVGFLATPQPAQAAPPESTPWLHTDVPAHLGFQMYWWDGFTAERDDSVTGYDVQYREMGATSWISHPHSGTVRAVEISNLAEGRQYQVRVRATNSDGDGPWSDVENVPSVLGYPALPNPPFPVVVESGNASAKVTWGRPSHTGGRTLTGYVVRLLLRGGDAALRTIEITGANTASASIAGLTNDTDYELDMYATYGARTQGGRQTGRFGFTPTGSGPSFEPTPTFPTLWSATLTVKKLEYGLGCGYRSGEPQCGDDLPGEPETDDNLLTNDVITYHEASYEVELVHVAYAGGTLQFIVDKELRDRDGSITERSRLVLNVDGREFPIADAMVSQGIADGGTWTNTAAWVLTWTGTGLSWSEDQQVSLSLVTRVGGV